MCTRWRNMIPMGRPPVSYINQARSIANEAAATNAQYSEAAKSQFNSWQASEQDEALLRKMPELKDKERILQNPAGSHIYA